MSEFVFAVLDALERDGPAPGAPGSVLPVTAPGNTHTFGVRPFAELLEEHGVSADLLLGATPDEVLRRLAGGQYLGLGISDPQAARRWARSAAARLNDAHPGHALCRAGPGGRPLVGRCP